MSIKEELLKSKTQNKEDAMRIAVYACESKKNFKELMHCFLANEYRLAQRAAWSVSWAATKKPEMIKPYISNLVGQLLRNDAHPAVVRNSIRIIQHTEVPEKKHGELMNACFQLIEKPGTPVAIKAFALTVLHRLSKIYPEIKGELKTLIETVWENETAAFRSRGKHILKSL